MSDNNNKLVEEMLKMSAEHTVAVLSLQKEIERYKNDLMAAQQTILYKDQQIGDLKEEVDKLLCVLKQKVMGGKPDILATIQVNIFLYIS